MSLNKEILKKVIISQKEQRKNLMLIERDKMKEVMENANHPFIQIITGIRRSGKSTLLHQLRESHPEHEYVINFDDNRLFGFDVNDFEKLNDAFLDLYGEQKTFYFDEIQNVEGWELYIRRLYNEGKKIFITGSNAHMLSREMGTHLTGINIQSELYPFSFREFLKWKEIEFVKTDIYSNTKVSRMGKLFNQYTEKGGMPENLQASNPEILKNLYENILYRDVIVRHRVKQEKTIVELLNYLISNISKEYSFNALKNIFGLSNANTVKEYINYFEQSYLLFSINKFDYSLKKQMINPKKIYAIDSGLANSVSFRFSEDKGRQLENIVFLELKRRKYEVFYHKSKSECDFIVRIANRTVNAIQVCQTLYEASTREREVKGLLEAMQQHRLQEGLILTLDEKDEFEKDGFAIKVIPVWEWLLLM